jgi:hypothetical protein
MAGGGQSSSDSRAPVFVVGASRSGTNLLRAILNRHSEIWIPAETHYFDDLRPRLGAGATTRLDGSTRKRVEDYFLALGHRPYSWGGDPEQSAVDRDELAALAGELGGTGDAYFQAFCALRARQRGKSRWAEKTPRHVYRIAEILGVFPDARIVCLVRDPRGVIASYRDWHRSTPNSPPDLAAARAADQERTRRSYNIVLVSLLWRSVVRSALTALRRHGPERVYLQQFERLALEPEAAVAELCEWLGLGYEPTMLDVPVKNSSYSMGDETGVSREPVDRWRAALSPAEVAVIQRCCGELMDELGYERIPVAVSTVRVALAWASLVPATVRAAVANRSRLGRPLQYVRRRVAPALDRSQASNAATVDPSR